MFKNEMYHFFRTRCTVAGLHQMCCSTLLEGTAQLYIYRGQLSHQSLKAALHQTLQVASALCR